MQNRDFITEIEQEIAEFNSALDTPTDKSLILEQVKALSLGENDFYRVDKKGNYILYTKKPRFNKVSL
ncbi:UNVERIFIED_CONTAM: hypothetical protein RF648_18445 [Kocuria sp. CPCC 205274]|uniref:Uncharacterized protein n=1 Tax=Herbiconiux daphne TaxID=2970914 RepID=A0ABT2HBP0_9MICO|nr:hypothetical protein [Herbiconiux daphne]MCS5737380.1 hypothetical protein [Herbiconiux daphne]